LFDAQLLVTEEDHQTIHERVMHLLELLVPERSGQIDAEDLRAHVRRRVAYFDGLIAHVPSSLSGRCRLIKCPSREFARSATCPPRTGPSGTGWSHGPASTATRFSSPNSERLAQARIGASRG